MVRLDAHQHFWHFDPIRDSWITEPDMSNIRRNFMPDDLLPILQKNNFDGCIAVQADQSEAETKFLLELAEKNNFIKGVVGWIDLKADNQEERLNYFSQFKALKGFRHILQNEKPEFMTEQKFIEGVKFILKKGYTYDILVYPRHLKAIRSKFLRLFDYPTFVIDHIAKPYIKQGLFKDWAKNMKVIAKREHVYCKVSGMVTEAYWQNWKEEDFNPYLDVIFESFGEDRIMYGSDWPVCLVAATYEQQLSIIQNYVSRNKIDARKIFGENAKDFYRIKKVDF